MEIKLTEIVINRTIDENGKQLFSVALEKDFNFIEVLGLLEAAKWNVYQRVSGGHD